MFLTSGAWHERHEIHPHQRAGARPTPNSPAGSGDRAGAAAE